MKLGTLNTSNIMMQRKIPSLIHGGFKSLNYSNSILIVIVIEIPNKYHYKLDKFPGNLFEPFLMNLSFF